MRVVYKSFLKKLSIDDIKQMRQMVREGLPYNVIGKIFKVHQTTVAHHTGDIKGHYVSREELQ